MPQPIGLIQIVSEEAMPSLLPMLALKPAAVTHIVSGSFEQHSMHIMRAADSVGAAPDPNEYEERILQQMPSMADTNRAVSDAISVLQRKGLRPVLNFTGGTKLMSIGAFKAASAAAVTSLYVDGGNRCFLDGGTGPELADLLPTGLSLDTLAPKLSVTMFLVAHGCEQKSRSRNIDALVPLAKHLLMNREDEELAFQAMAGKNGAFAKLKSVRNTNKWREADKISFQLPEKLAKVAEMAGIIARDGDQATLRAESTGSKVHDPGLSLQARYQFFEGGWWEVVVADAVARCGDFADVHVNVSIAKGGRNPMEEDVLAVQGLQLAYFSCKRSSADKLVRHLEEVDASARRLGGKFARKYLAVCHLPDWMRSDLQKRAAQLQVKLLEPPDIADDASLLRALNS
jgi:hypothetical protein